MRVDFKKPDSPKELSLSSALGGSGEQKKGSVLLELSQEVIKEFLNSLRVIEESAKILDKRFGVSWRLADDGQSFLPEHPALDGLRCALRRHLNIIHQEIYATKEMLQELNELLLSSPPEPAKVSVQEIIDDAISSLDSPIPPTIKLITDFPKLLPTLWVDRYQMRWAFCNIIRASIYNMLSGGKLIISGKVLPPESDLSNPPKADHVAGKGSIRPDSNTSSANFILTISDTGIGISAQKQPKIFHPLALPKTRRIGLGLIIAQYLIGINRGKLEQRTHPGIGTSFVIRFPIQSELNQNRVCEMNLY
jgi:signal transduction histidine kinase